MGGRRHLPLRPVGEPGRDLLDRHAAADRQRQPAHGLTSSATCRPTPSRASSACAAARSSTRWAGTTTACPPSAACRTTTAFAAIPHLAVRPRFEPPEKPREGSASDLASELPRALRATRSRRTRRRSRSCGAGSGLSVDWTLTYTTIGTAAAAHEPARVPAQSRRGARRTRPTRRRCGTSTFAPRSRRRSSRTASSPGAYHALRFHRADGAGDLLIDTTRPELLAACVAVVAHPDDERYRRSSVPRSPRRCTASRARGRAPVGRSREGDRDRDDLHVRRRHRRGLVARVAASDAGDHRRRRPAARPSRPRASSDGCERVRRDRGQEREAGAEAGGGAARAKRASSKATRARSPTRSSSTSAATARSRSSRRGSGTSATAGAMPTCAPTCCGWATSCAGTPGTCGPATTPGSTVSTPTGS